MFRAREKTYFLERISMHGLNQADFKFTEGDHWMELEYVPAHFHFRIIVFHVGVYLGKQVEEMHINYTPERGGLLLNNENEVDEEVPDWEGTKEFIYEWFNWLRKDYIGEESISRLKQASRPSRHDPLLAHLHPTIQAAAGSLYGTGHYRQALLDACIAIDNAVREKSKLTGSGTRLMEVAFSPGNPVLNIGDSPDEQQGFLALFRGLMLAVRNPKAHSLGGTADAQRALEWLSFASVLLRNLDEAVLAQPTAAPPAP